MIKIKDVTFGYKKGKKILEELDLELLPGHIYGLLGKNGAGKSTLLRLISTLAFPQKGECIIAGYHTRHRASKLLQDVFFIPEQFDLPDMSSKRYADLHKVFYPEFSQEQFEKFFQEFELSHHSDISAYSYGQKKKFMIAFGLATNAKIILLDEPTNGLDIPSKSQFRRILASALDENKIVILSTHQVRDLENLIDVVLVLDNKKIIFNKDTFEITRVLTFTETLSHYREEDIIYTESVNGRKSGITINTDHSDSKVDLELLFNCILKNNVTINKHF